MAGVLAVDAPGCIDRCRRVGGAQRKLLEETLLKRPALANRVQVAVLTIGVDHAVDIDYWGIHTPLEMVWMVGNTTDGSVLLARTTHGVGVLEHPLRC